MLVSCLSCFLSPFLCCFLPYFLALLPSCSVAVPAVPSADDTAGAVLSSASLLTSPPRLWTAHLPARRQRVQARAKELEKAKKAFVEGERSKREQAAKGMVKETRVGGA